MNKKQLIDVEPIIGVDEQVRQLMRVARLESDRLLQECKALVFGSGVQAQGLYETMKQQCSAVRMVDSVADLQEDEQFELAIILEPISHRVLENLMAPSGIAIDANMQRSGEWVMYDKSLSFKRIRVLSLLGRRANHP
ncbi:MAG: hypothetical protein ACK5L0_06195 [Candidatus Fimivivens sp.]